MKGQAKRVKTQKENIMEKTTLLKIIKAVRDLEIKKSVNDSKFNYYNKKRKAIDYKSRQIQNEIHKLIWSEHKEGAITEKFKELDKKQKEYKKQTEEELESCLIAMDKIENNNKVINNQIQQYLTNYVLTILVDKLNKSKTFNYKKLDKIFKQIEMEADKIHNFEYCYCSIYMEDDYYLVLKFRNYSDKMYIMYDFKKYLESHLTKKTITKKFSYDDFKNFISWDIKTPEQEAQDNATTENKLNALKSKIEKLISDYNQERKKLTINQDSYKYMYMRQD